MVKPIMVKTLSTELFGPRNLVVFSVLDFNKIIYITAFEILKACNNSVYLLIIIFHPK